uniref:Uncharacterized protein n=2 Tax=Meloidogyne TaxID=189290 RepID=A0A914P0L0_MELIC
MKHPDRFHKNPPPPSCTSSARLQLQWLLSSVYNFNSSCQPSTTSTASASRLQLQLLLPDVYNFYCADSTVPWAQTRYSNEPPGPTLYSTVYTHFIRPLSSTYPKSDPNVTPQNAPDKTSLPKTPRTKRHSPIRPGQNVTSQNAPDKTSLPKTPRIKHHSPKYPGQNDTPQIAPDKTSLPNSSHRQNITPQFVPQTKYHSPIRPENNPH